jgi:arginyl-tRNA synthetase
MASVRTRLVEMLRDAISSLTGADNQPIAGCPVELDNPRLPEHGDYATNLALSLTRQVKRSPKEIAARILDNLKDPDDIIERVEIAGPGFMNFFVNAHAWRRVLPEIQANPESFGRQSMGKGKRVQVEFVSANPTGPLHIGHGRGAATGDVLSNILRACGYEVEREYYINDAGNQMDTLGRSLYYRYRQLLGENVELPEGHYRGDYMLDLAGEFKEKVGNRYEKAVMEEVLPDFTSYAGNSILDGIKDDLAAFGVSFDTWFSEQSLHDSDEIRKTMEALEARGYIYVEDGAKWFRSTAFGDEKDRVVVRANGVSTYFASDLAYHKNKFERGFDLMVDIWGADHHGYVERLLAGAEALGRKRSDVRIILVQLVNLLRGGQPVAMSTRAGEFVTLREVIDEVGKDAARYIFLTRRSDSQLDFDLDVAKMQSNDNPVFYVQYAHARLCSVFEVAAERGIRCSWSEGATSVNLGRLDVPQELQVMKLLGEYPDVIANCARALEPHYIPYYLHELVSLFHSYYNHNRIIGDDMELTEARLYLASAIRAVIRNALGLLGVAAPEKM